MMVDAKYPFERKVSNSTPKASQMFVNLTAYPMMLYRGRMEKVADYARNPLLLLLSLPPLQHLGMPRVGF